MTTSRTFGVAPGSGGAAPDAAAGTKGLIQLAGDLSGTAASPTVPGLSGKAATVHTHAESDVTSLVSDLAAKAPLASPALTGTPTAPTASAGTSTTQVATTAFATTADALKADKSANLSDLASVSTARTNLGLGGAALLAVGTTAGTVLAPDAIDAKGDLLAGTAADTIARVAVGTNGQRLAADSTQTAGVAWVTPDPSYGLPLISGYYIASGGTRSTLAMVQSVEYAVPVYLAQAGTIVRLGCEVTAAGAASTVVRLGIRADTNHLPGSVLGEITVAGDAISASGVEGTVSIVIPAPGVYWFTATAQGGTPTVRSCTGPTGFASGAASLATAVGATPNGGYITAATVTGALPGTYTVSNRSGGLPLVVARI